MELPHITGSITEGGPKASSTSVKRRSTRQRIKKVNYTPSGKKDPATDVNNFNKSVANAVGSMDAHLSEVSLMLQNMIKPTIEENISLRQEVASLKETVAALRTDVLDLNTQIVNREKAANIQRSQRFKEFEQAVESNNQRVETRLDKLTGSITKLIAQQQTPTQQQTPVKD